MDHSYLGPTCDRAVELHHFALGETATLPLMLTRTLVLPGERAALALPTALLSSLSSRGAPALCLLALLPQRALMGTLVRVTACREEDSLRAAQLCTCLGLCRVRVSALHLRAGLAQVRVLDTLEDAPLPLPLPAQGAHLPAWLYARMDAQRLARRVRQLWALAGLQPPPPPSQPPAALAWWVLRSLPLDDRQRRAVFGCAGVSSVLARQCRVLRRLAGGARLAVLSCAACQARIVRDSVAALASPFGGAGGDRGGSHVFVNPAGVSFRVFTARALAEGCGARVLGRPSLEHTWFAGYSWQACECQCGLHLGWRYTSAPAAPFYGLRVEAVKMALEAEGSAEEEGAEESDTVE